jgi:2-desacetyl-2-hydroxyethyl bacteriochlorophyllide A dehydrogenase
MKVFAAMEAGKTCFVDIPVPEPKADEALVRIEGCVICNTTDWMVIHSHFGAPDFPVLVGHESIGRVVKTGSQVKHLKIGDRVTRANAIPTGFNGEYYSAWGGFSEYGIVKDKPPVKGLGDLPLEKAGLLIPLSETASCLMQFESLKDKDVLVTGTGAAGLSLVYFAKKFGARNVLCSGRRMERLELAKRLGADQVYPDGGNGIRKAAAEVIEVDFVFEATGKYDVFQDGIPLLKSGGTLAIYGTPEKPYIINAEKSPANYKRMQLTPKEEMAYEVVCELLMKESGLSDIFMTHRWGFDKLQDAFEQVRNGEVIKGIAVME